ncbi:small oligopeptide transporter [Exidia glandulosa HHB12029]|uniref:Small oligopeptide transporter n=1 Tax=Exidia glandulosa HHB12029 TaxID=1314781 RepID=A0A165CZA8_EXIGL|nr:small oligopeptide transporter [Exidia glandulosa HHB12029]
MEDDIVQTPGEEEDSPYPEVRCAVANIDDASMPASTLRAWLIGILCSILIPGLNQFLFFRYPSVSIAQLVAQVVSFPIGRLAAAVLPHWRILGIELNPGPFSIKEHVLITVMSGVGSSSAYATDIIAVQRVFYNQSWSFSYQWMIVLSTQLIGFSLGGILRRVLVDPPSMIWPANLVFCALFNTLHSQHYTGLGNRGGISREKFFVIVLVASGLWYFVPGYLFTALSYFSWVCWIAPNNVKVNQMFGYFSGMGMSLITFDWAQISYIGSPLATPWWAEANVAVGFTVFFWVLTPILYYSNAWYGAYMPILARGIYDNTGAPYNVSRVLTEIQTFNETAYHEYSPLFLSTTFALSYGLSFAAITSTVVHTILYYRHQIWHHAGRSLRERPDIHAKLMSRYRQVPHYWYLLVFACSFAFGIVSITVWPSEMPVWAFVVALIIAAAFAVPVGMIQAITNQQIGLNVVTELIVGYALPGRPVAMMMFKTWGYITMAQSLNFASDFKLGHYMKIPPRSMFLAQIVATAVAGTTQLCVQTWMFENIKDICTGNEVFSCPSTQVFFAASAIWGTIGPERQFSYGQIYYGLSFFFLIGALAPVVPWIFTRRYPNSWWRYVNFPVVFSGTSLIPPATAVNYVPWCITGFIFQYFIRRRHFSWWAKYNYVLSAALDSGVAFASIIIFFALQYPKDGTIGQDTIGQWWGNTVYLDTLDFKNAAFKRVPEGGHFGPTSW